MDLSELNADVDDVLIGVGVAVLVVRQFLWRSADPRRILRVPVVVIAVGLAMTLQQAVTTRWAAADWLLVVELLLVAATGAAMGAVTRFRDLGAQRQYRLTGVGVALWAVFLVVRLGSALLAAALGADLAAASGLVLLSFGVNRLAAALVVQRRARLLAADVHPGRRRGPTTPPRAEDETAAPERDVAPTVPRSLP